MNQSPSHLKEQNLFTWGALNDCDFHVLSPDSQNSTHTHCVDQITHYVIEKHPQLKAGQVEYITISNEIRIIITNCIRRHDSVICVSDDGWVRFNFELDLDPQTRVAHPADQPSGHQVWRVLHLPQNTQTVERIKGDALLRWMTICIRPHRIQQLCGFDITHLLQPFSSSTASKNPHSTPVYHHFPLNQKLAYIIKEIMHTQLTHQIRLQFIVTKATEILLLALNELVNKQPPHIAQSTVLPDKEREKLLKAERRITQNLAHSPSIKELCQLTGLNRTKLYYGFKTVFGMNTTEFIKFKRLEEGYRLITETDRSLMDIALAIGFQHQSNFSTAIKIQYGLTPRQLRDLHR